MSQSISTTIPTDTLGKPFTPTYHHTTYPAISPSRPSLSAHEKVVLITGGNQGIGKATARAFAQANAHALIITGRTPHTLLSAKSELEQINSTTQVRTFVADVTDAGAVRTMFESIKQEFGRVDVLVSNAGYLPDAAPISEQNPDDFWKAFEVNTKGTFIVVRAFLSTGVASPNASLINMSTIGAHIPFAGHQGYCCSKTATLRFFEFVQNENENLRVVSVHPGVILSAMSTKADLTPEDDETLPAHFQVWLAGPEADFLKGKMVWANWDVEELKARKEEIIRGHLLEMSLKGYERYY